MLASVLLLAFPVERPGVRFVLVVPPGETPFADAQARFGRTLHDLQWWYACQMQASGYGAKTFSFETDSRGNLVVNVARLVGEPPSDPNALRTACVKSAEGVLGDARARQGTIMLMVYEGYAWKDRDRLSVNPMGSSVRGRWSFLTAWQYFGDNPEGWREPTSIPRLPLQNAYYPPLATRVFQAFKDDGVKTVGERSSVGYGVVAHELGHAFGLHHPDPKAPRVFGNVMTADDWHMRGNFLADDRKEYCRLIPSDAAILNGNPLFGIRPAGPSSTGVPYEVGARGAL